MAAKKMAPVALLVVMMGGAGFWAMQMMGELEVEEEEKVRRPEAVQPPPVRVEASQRGGALSGLSRVEAPVEVASNEAGADAGGSAELVARGGALAGITKRRTQGGKSDVGLEEQEDWSEGPREVMGPSRWMRQRMSDEESRELQSELELGEMEQARILAMREDRQSSIDAVEVQVRDCFAVLVAQEPERSGRLGLTWTMLAGGGVGLVTEPRVRANIGLREPGFEACVAGALQGVEFEATGESEILVEWAFMP